MLFLPDNLHLLRFNTQSQIAYSAVFIQRLTLDLLEEKNPSANIILLPSCGLTI